MSITKIDALKQEMQEVLYTNILPYWMQKMIDPINGGFYGRITGKGILMPEADKGAILNARILWTYASAYRLSDKQNYLVMAIRAKEYILNHFYDKEQGGVYWSLNFKGEPLDAKKQIYALGFTIYGMSELYRATGDKEALECAISLFKSIEEHSFDKLKNGYCEALTRNWGEIADMRLSDKDANEKKTMNTHLHILEAYTTLYRVWKDELLKNRLGNLIEIFLTKILDSKTAHLKLFFDENWHSKADSVSYGHDIEASWLIHEAAIVLADENLLKRVELVVPAIAKAASEGLCADGSMIYEKDPKTKHLDADRHWWVQAEAVVGYVNMYQHFGDKDALDKAVHVWQYIKSYLIDYSAGEWYWSIKADGSVNKHDDKAGFWKCPYHNGRMCMEIMERVF